MITIVSTISIIIYFAVLLGFRRKIIEQQFIFLVVFLAGLTLIGELDLLLPIYFVFSFLPFVLRTKKISFFTAMIALYFIVLLIYGLAFQNSIRTIVTFIAKIWQFVVFFIIKDDEIQLEERDYKPLFVLAVIVESVLGIYLMLTSNKIDSANGLIRLVNNSQPITGNLATVMLPLSAFYYFVNRRDPVKSKFLVVSNLILLIWIVLSGTRGYTLEYVFVMFLIFYDYFINSKSQFITRRNRIFKLLVLLVFGVILLFVIPGMFEKAATVLRLKASVGIRKYENAAVIDFLKNAPLQELFFGIGLGGTGYKHEALQNALYKQFSLGMWNRKHYMNESGALFHSLYSNIALCLGLLGLVIILVIFVKMWKSINDSCGNSVFIRRILHAFLIGFFFMNYYRWSSDCGIAEMIMLALVLKLSSKQLIEFNKDDSEYNKVDSEYNKVDSE